jgi:hypothetical protein
VLETLEDITKALSSSEVYIQLYGSSGIQFLRPALVELYSDLISFGLRAIRLFNRSIIRMILCILRLSPNDHESRDTQAVYLEVAEARF